MIKIREPKNLAEALEKANANLALQMRCSIACVLSIVAAVVLYLVSWGIYGMHDDPTTMEAGDQYCSYVIFGLIGMAVAFHQARRWIKSG